MVRVLGSNKEKGQEPSLWIVNKRDFDSHYYFIFLLYAWPLEALESWNVLPPHSVTSLSSANSCDLSSLPYQ